MKGLRTVLVLSFSFACLANMLIGLVPADSETGQRIKKSLDGPRWTTGTWQIWDMFRTIPYIHRPSTSIVAKGADGREHRFGLALPGLRGFDPVGEIRYHYTFVRMFADGTEHPAFVDDYARAVAAELVEKNLGLVEFSIVSEHEVTRHLFHIRKDGKFGSVVRRESESFPIPIRR